MSSLPEEGLGAKIFHFKQRLVKQIQFASVHYISVAGYLFYKAMIGKSLEKVKHYGM